MRHDQRTFIIAEAGINHNGSRDVALELVRVAAEAGCDAVKFQKRTIEKVYTDEELAKPRESPFGTTNGDLKRALELSYEDYQAIDQECRDYGILLSVSPWDEKSVGLLDSLPPFHIFFYKVASACLTDSNLLRRIRATHKPVILSTGMSTLQEIRAAKEILHPSKVALLSCCSAYPAPLNEINLRTIQTLKNEFPECQIGYSGHEDPSEGADITLAAVAMGAQIVERHITLDRTMFGSDQKASIEPHELQDLVTRIRKLEKAMGTGTIGVTESEQPIKAKLRRVSDLFDAERVF